MLTTPDTPPSHGAAAGPEGLASLRVYNTLTKAKEPFRTVRPGEVGIYLCGPTVYKPSHLGHMVGPVIFDAIKRYLTYCGYRVTLVINITDVDDKLIAESAARGITMAALAEEMTADYLRNLQAMGVDTVDHFPRATAHISDILAMTERLLNQGHAYAADGDVYFDVGRASEYGKLSRRSIEALEGEGGATAERKRNVADFALWKSAKPGEPSWPSPWGPGRPGWHIECSAMSGRLLGKTFDIHGGGLDLVFPHHENEIAQSECANHQPMALYWMHNGLMQASSEIGKLGGRATRALDEGDQAAQEAGKMGKSKGASAFRDLLQQFQPETIRFFLLSTHYRRPIDYSEERLHEVERGLDKFYRFFKRFERIAGRTFYSLTPTESRTDGRFDPGGEATLVQVLAIRERFLEFMDDDFNSGGATGALFELVGLLNAAIDSEKLEAQAAARPAAVAVLTRGATTLRELAATLGLFRAPVAATSAGDDQLVRQLIELLISVRADARKSKNFALADRLRQDLAALGVLLEDRPDGTEFTIQR
jgi:cysteinyl-tRNA synthetase